MANLQRRCSSAWTGCRYFSFLLLCARRKHRLFDRQLWCFYPSAFDKSKRLPWPQDDFKSCSFSCFLAILRHQSPTVHSFAMSQNSSSSSPQILRPLVIPPPGFLPGALYVAIIEKTIQSSTPGDMSPPTTVKSLGFFYQEKPTFLPITGSLKTEPFLEGCYWSFLPPSQPTNGTMSVYNALHHQDVLGYVRVAELVNPRSLPTLIEADDGKVHSMEQMSPEIYVFNALERLRRHGFLEANMGTWNFANFVAEMNYFRHEWRYVGLREEWLSPRPFADLPLIFFSSHVDGGYVLTSKGKNAKHVGS